MTKKILLFIMSILIILFSVFIAYLTLIFPKQYVKEVEKRSYETVVELEKNRCSKTSSELYFQLEYQKGSDEIQVCSTFGIISIAIDDPTLKARLDDFTTIPTKDFTKQDFEALTNTLNVLDFQSNITVIEKFDLDYETEYSVKVINDNQFIMNFGSNYEDNSYLNLVAFTQDKDKLSITYMPTVINNLNATSTVVLKALPVIFLILIILIFISLWLFEKQIKKPIDMVTKAIKNQSYDNLKIQTGDELELLAKTLINFNKETKTLVLKLQQENDDKEFFLTACAHELKTPISNSTLMLEGMIDQVGKYKDTQKYLNAVNEEMYRLNKITNNLLKIVNYDIEFNENVDIKVLVKNILSSKQEEITAKNLAIDLQIENSIVLCNEMLLVFIVENLIVNAITYANHNSTVTISFHDKNFKVSNYSDNIRNIDIDSITKPFVKFSSIGHGLGLYITKYYANKLGFEFNVSKDVEMISVSIIMEVKND